MLNLNTHISCLLCARHGAGCCKSVRYKFAPQGDLGEETEEMESLDSVMGAVIGRRKDTWEWCPLGFKKSFQKPPE